MKNPLPIYNQKVSLTIELTDLAQSIQTNMGISLAPSQAYEHDAGFDVRACILEELTLLPHERMLIGTGLKFELESPEWEIQVRPRSGLAAKNGIMIVNSPGTVDYLYRDEIKIILYNSGDKPFTIMPGDRIAQLCVRQVPQVQFVYRSVTETGRGGFGSSGVH